MKVAEVGGRPAGVIMGKDCGAWKPSVTGLLRQTAAALALLSGKEGREVARAFSGINQVDKELLKAVSYTHLFCGNISCFLCIIGCWIVTEN